MCFFGGGFLWLSFVEILVFFSLFFFVVVLFCVFIFIFYYFIIIIIFFFFFFGVWGNCFFICVLGFEFCVGVVDLVVYYYYY